ncbi:unnamed protein product [Cuscuta epithymum]|uniref:Uncharacterized protein n=1 Tax=Cuscuta epithymum TaxID=186058 RepID=A0AAV0EES6_9ASTE|nr:unnamed protein product [Cuscuta epithymum]
MRSRLLTLITTLAFLIHPTYPQPRPPTWDSMMLALTWSPGYCSANKDTCDPQRIKPDFTIHDLWPYSECGSMFVDPNASLFDMVTIIYILRIYIFIGVIIVVNVGITLN